MNTYKLIAKTFAGLEPILAKEIKDIGGFNIDTGRRAVFFEGDLELIYKSNYFLRTALKIFKEIQSFRFRDVGQFYLKCKNIDWEKHFDVNQNFAVYSTVVHSREFNNSMFASLKVKDAIVDYFRQKTGKRPNVDPKNPEIIIKVYINQNN